MNPTCSLGRLRARRGLNPRRRSTSMGRSGTGLGADNPMPRPRSLSTTYSSGCASTRRSTPIPDSFTTTRTWRSSTRRLHFSPNSLPHERQRTVEAARDHYAEILRRIAGVNGPLSAEDQHIRDMWAPSHTSALLEATDPHPISTRAVRPLSRRLETLRAWERTSPRRSPTWIARELAVLPHVESSFNQRPIPRSAPQGVAVHALNRQALPAYRQYVDDRLDPFRSTQAAAQLLAYNYHLLGTWPWR